MIETPIDELKTLTDPPEAIHLNIGMKGVLHTYYRGDAPKAVENPDINELRDTIAMLEEYKASLAETVGDLENQRDALFEELRKADLTHEVPQENKIDEHVDSELFNAQLSEASTINPTGMDSIDPTDPNLESVN